MFSGNNSGSDNLHIQCPQCSKQINILNNDIQYSLDLHYVQTHTSLDSIGEDIDRQLSRAKLGPNVQINVQTNYESPESSANVQVFGNDVTQTLERHARKHQRSDMEAQADDLSSASSGTSQNSNNSKQNYLKNNTVLESEKMNVLDNIFCKMQPELKAHRGFLFVNEPGEIVCRLCHYKVDSLNQISDHLVTKSHEDNTISFIKSKLPNELAETMDFVSIYRSNLCCNLCKCKIDLNSLNLTETIINIIAHNSGQQHVKKKESNEPLNRSKEGMKKLNFLASKDSLINSYKHMVRCEMQPQYKCTLCDKLIPFDQNDQMMLKNFTSHLSSAGHNKCVTATSVLSMYNSTYQPRGGKHNLVVTKGSVSCTVCNVSMEPTLETLDAHVKKVDSSANIGWPADFSAKIKKLDFTGPKQSFNTKEQNNEAGASKVLKVNDLLKCMPPPFKKVKYVVESGQGQVTCQICDCVIPPTVYNLQTHLTGNSHMKKLSSTNKTSSTNSAKSQNVNSHVKEKVLPASNKTKQTENGVDKVLDYLQKSDPLIRKNLSVLAKRNKNDDDNIYFCKLCKTTLPPSNDVISIKQNLLTHLSGTNHAKQYADKQESEIKKQLQVDPVVRANKQYLRKHEESLLCTLCDVQLSLSIDGTKLKRNLTGHLNGQQHQSKVNGTTDPENCIIC